MDAFAFTKCKILIDERVSMARMQFIHNLSQIFYLWNFQALRKGSLIRNDRLLGQEISNQISEQTEKIL